MIQLLREGGYLMIPLIGCSILALAIVIERFISLRVIEKKSKRFANKTRSIINGNDDNKVEKVLALCEMTSSPLSRILNCSSPNWTFRNSCGNDKGFQRNCCTGSGRARSPCRWNL